MLQRWQTTSLCSSRYITAGNTANAYTSSATATRSTRSTSRQKLHRLVVPLPMEPCRPRLHLPCLLRRRPNGGQQVHPPSPLPSLQPNYPLKFNPQLLQPYRRAGLQRRPSRMASLSNNDSGPLPFGICFLRRLNVIRRRQERNGQVSLYHRQHKRPSGLLPFNRFQRYNR